MLFSAGRGKMLSSATIIHPFFCVEFPKLWADTLPESSNALQVQQFVGTHRNADPPPPPPRSAMPLLTTAPVSVIKLYATLAYHVMFVRCLEIGRQPSMQTSAKWLWRYRQLQRSCRYSVGSSFSSVSPAPPTGTGTGTDTKWASDPTMTTSGSASRNCTIWPARSPTDWGSRWSPAEDPATTQLRIEVLPSWRSSYIWAEDRGEGQLMIQLHPSRGSRWSPAEDPATAQLRIEVKPSWRSSCIPAEDRGVAQLKIQLHPSWGSRWSGSRQTSGTRPSTGRSASQTKPTCIVWTWPATAETPATHWCTTTGWTSRRTTSTTINRASPTARRTLAVVGGSAAAAVSASHVCQIIVGVSCLVRINAWSSAEWWSNHSESGRHFTFDMQNAAPTFGC